MEGLVAITGAAAVCGFSYLVKGVSEVPQIYRKSLGEPINKDILKVMSLNIAHGRGRSLHQLLMRHESIKSNLKKISEVIQIHNPDLCALQEVDARTLYSNRLHQGRYLTDHSNMLEYLQGRHVQGLNFDYGTGLLSKTPLSDPLSQVFPFKAPNPTKGFVTGCIQFNDCEVDIASLHLDFLNSKLRRRQLKLFIEQMQLRQRPLIVMGDFNCDYKSRGLLAEFCSQTGLSAWEPQDKTPTFLRTKKRLDWILVSPHFEIVHSQVLTDVLSDHLPITADIRWR